MNMNKVTCIALFLVLIMISACQNGRERLVSNDVDTLLNDQYVRTEDYEEDMARIRSEVDIKVDSLKAMMDENQTFDRNRFHMIVGSFRVPSNADAYLGRMKSMGYDAQIITNPNGLRMVAVKSYNNLRNALSEVNRFRQELDVQAWIYITR